MPQTAMRCIGGSLLYLSLSVVQAMAEPARIVHAFSFPPYAEAKDGSSQGLAVDILRAARRAQGSRSR